MARERAAKRREGNEIEFGRIVAFSDGVFAIAITLREFRLPAFFVAIVFLASIPLAFVSAGLAPLLWLTLFLDPVSRRFGRT